MKCHSKNNNVFQKTVNIVLDILVVLFTIILVISIYSGIQTKFLGKDYTDFFGYSIFEVQTGSMAPEINAGDWIIVKLTSNVKLNDVVTYEANGEYITHRVKEVYKDTYVTKGDANTVKDGIINKEQTVGRVVKVLGGIGIFKRILFNPAVLIALIVTFTVCSFAFKNKNSMDKLKKMKVYIFLSNLFKKTKTKVFDDFETSKKAGNEIEDVFNNYDKDIKKEEIINETDELKVEEVKVEQISGETKEDLAKYDIEELSLLSDEEIEKELDKTSIFREIIVDKSEINDTLLEIANNQIDKEAVKVEKPKLKENESTRVLIEEKDEIDLKLLQDKNKKTKNKSIIEKAMLIKSEEINEIMAVLNFDNSREVNEVSIKNSFIEAYINAKYYNNYTDVDIEYNALNKRIKFDKFLNDYKKKLNYQYKGNDRNYGMKVEKYTELMILIASLDEAEDIIEETKIKIEFYKEKISNYISISHITQANIDDLSAKIMKIKRSYESITDYLLKKLDTSVFNLELNRINAKKDMYAIKLNHNIAFSRVYSDYIIDKTYNEGVIAEDKLEVLLNLLSVQLVKDMLASDFFKEYIMYIPTSLYTKKRKFESLLKLVEDEYAKGHTVMLITYDDLIKNEVFIKKLRNTGYRIALIISSDTKGDIKESKLCISDYIFVDKSDIDIIKDVKMMSDDISMKIIYDNIIEKIGDFEVDKQ